MNALTSDGRSYTATATSGDMRFKSAKVHNIKVVVHGKGEENGHEYVNLGLPSGLKWATMNVGANSPVECGTYYAWGETEPAQFGYYGWDLYRLCNGSMKTLTKYCTNSEYGKVDGQITLDKANDVAHVKWGGNWRMPTKLELDELINNCYWEWTMSYNNDYGAGYIVYAAKSDEDKGKILTSEYAQRGDAPSSKYSLSDPHIFLPFGSCMSESKNRNDGSVYLWSSTLDKDHCWLAYQMRICNRDGFRYKTGAAYRYYGMNVRAVFK